MMPLGMGKEWMLAERLGESEKWDLGWSNPDFFGRRRSLGPEPQALRSGLGFQFTALSGTPS